MPDDDTICGELTAESEICKLPAGWGRDDSTGPCKWHTETKPVPPKLTEQLIVDMETELRNGHSVRAACGINNLGTTTHYRWIDWADELDSDETSERAELLREYRDRVTHANDAGEHYLEQQIVDIAVENGDAATLLRYLQEQRGGTASQTPEETGPLATIPTDEQIEQLLANE